MRKMNQNMVPETLIMMRIVKERPKRTPPLVKEMYTQVR